MKYLVQCSKQGSIGSKYLYKRVYEAPTPMEAMKQAYQDGYEHCLVSELTPNLAKRLGL